MDTNKVSDILYYACHLVADGGYKVNEHGVIESLGKFEGESPFTMYLFDAYMDGDGDYLASDLQGFTLTDAEMEAFGRQRNVALVFSDSGFVSTIEPDNWDSFVESIEAESEAE